MGLQPFRPPWKAHSPGQGCTQCKLGFPRRPERRIRNRTPKGGRPFARIGMHAVQVGLSKEAGTAEKKPDTGRRRQVDSQASSQASKQAGGQVARQGLTSNPTANGDLVSLIQKGGAAVCVVGVKKTILCFNHYYTPPYRVSISSHISCSQEYSKQ